MHNIQKCAARYLSSRLLRRAIKIAACAASRVDSLPQTLPGNGPQL